MNVEVRSTATVGEPSQEVDVKKTRRGCWRRRRRCWLTLRTGTSGVMGFWAYSWDAQNRLQWAVRQAETAGTGDATVLHFAYDHLGRRVGKIVYSGGATVKSKTIYFWDSAVLSGSERGARMGIPCVRAYGAGTELWGGISLSGWLYGMLCLLFLENLIPRSEVQLISGPNLD